MSKGRRVKASYEKLPFDALNKQCKVQVKKRFDFTFDLELYAFPP